MYREELLLRLSEAIANGRSPGPRKIAIDGIDGAGKTVLADDLVPYVQERGASVIRASLDAFHRPAAERYRRGRDSPEGFYRDSFDYEKLRALLLDPLSPKGDREYCTAAFDWRNDSDIKVVKRLADSNSILIFDGIFAQRRELLGLWDFCVFLDVTFDEALRRSKIRDRRTNQSLQQLENRFWARYAAGQRLYFSDAAPRERAQVLIDNNDFEKPRVVRWRPPR